MKLSYLHEFLVEYESLDRAVRKRIRKKLDELHRTPEERFQHQALRGKQLKGLFKLRAGGLLRDWRLGLKMWRAGKMKLTLPKVQDTDSVERLFIEDSADEEEAK